MGRRRPRSPREGRAARRRRASFTALFLQLKEALLASQAPGVAAESAVRTYGAVARHEQRYRVRAARASYGTHSRRRADGAGDLLVGARFSRRDAPQLLPDLS